MTHPLSRLKRLMRTLVKTPKKPESPAPQDFTVGRSRVRIGRFTYGKGGLIVKQWNEGAALTIGSFCSIAKDVTIILGGNHRTDWVTTFPFGHIYQDTLGDVRPEGHPATRGEVIIGHDVWLGYNATILSGISIGTGAVVAANATVTRDIAPYEIWGGNPARRIGSRFEPEMVDRLLTLEWWNLPESVIRKIVPDLSQSPTPETLDRISSSWKS
ncbi:CatB-related O-acetyltransferase [Sulfitobacter sp.]|uniref:CatB-related O-acetyltransferase n=1 Tax=Sulfitobacter sp. TaxID=1903071 RepID=UPI0035648102